MFALRFAKPLINSLVKPWLLAYLVLNTIQFFYPSWILFFLAQGAIFYGAVQRRKQYTYYPNKPEWFIHWTDVYLDAQIMFHESFVSAFKMVRMTLPFLGGYEWVQRSDQRLTQKGTSLLMQRLQAPVARARSPAPRSLALSDPAELFKPTTPLPAFVFDDDLETREAPDDASSEGSIDAPGEHSIHRSESELEQAAQQLTRNIETEEKFIEDVHQIEQALELVGSALHPKDE